MSGGRGGPSTQYDYLIKLLLVGDPGVGKSSLLGKFADGKFAPDRDSTIGMDFKVKMMDVSGRRVKLQVWDTAGQERFQSITKQYYRSAMGIILVYDSSDEESFANVRQWMRNVNDFGDDGTSLLLLGNKVDCELDPARRAVDAVRGQQLAEEYGIPFLEVSAKSGQNIVEAFTLIANAIRLRLEGRTGDGVKVMTEAAAAAGAIRLLSEDRQANQRRGCCPA
mmetsp:Transcript_62512/g.183258  ORF Transcript_62512/g.183258 Transcript_62512/m.183258 type:complete len:223 (-) Transcript_62512:17-685(-)